MFELKRLLAALTVYSHNVRMLHWNLKGVDFDPVHALMGDYYDQMDSYVDEVAEICIQLGNQPLNLNDAMDLLDKDTKYEFIILKSEDTYTSKECFDNINIMFTTLLQVYTDIYTAQLPAAIVNKLQEQDYWFRKEGLYKNKSRIR